MIELPMATAENAHAPPHAAELLSMPSSSRTRLMVATTRGSGTSILPANVRLTVDLLLPVCATTRRTNPASTACRLTVLRMRLNSFILVLAPCNVAQHNLIREYVNTSIRKWINYFYA
jgi:hypothetical protein